MAIRSRVVMPVRRARANRHWAGSGAAADFISVPAASKVLLGSFVITSGSDETVLRTVGHIAIASDQAAGNELQLGSFGMILVSDTAIALGITAIPGPVTDIDDDGWFVYQSFGQELRFFSGVGVEANFATPYPIDSKAKRRVENGRNVALVVENAHATHAFDIQFSVRVLTLTP